MKTQNSKTRTKKSTKPEIESVTTTLIDINVPLLQYKIPELLQTINIKNTIKRTSPYYREGYQYVKRLMYKSYDTQKHKPKLMFIQPYEEKRPFVRLLIDPSDMTSRELNLIYDTIYLNLGVVDYSILLKAINVDRLNIAYDIKNVVFEDLVFNRELQRTSAYQIGSDGRITSVYLGSKNSDLSFHIYDKNLNDKSKGIKPKPYPVLRIEAQINPKLPLYDIKKINNPFEGIKVYKLSHLVKDNKISTSFCDSIDRRGLKGALQTLSGVERKKVNTLLDKHIIKLAPSKKVFKLWHKEYEVILEAFDPSKKISALITKDYWNLSPSELKKIAEETQLQFSEPGSQWLFMQQQKKR